MFIAEEAMYALGLNFLGSILKHHDQPLALVTVVIDFVLRPVHEPFSGIANDRSHEWGWLVLHLT